MRGFGLQCLLMPASGRENSKNLRVVVAVGTDLRPADEPCRRDGFGLAVFP